MSGGSPDKWQYSPDQLQSAWWDVKYGGAPKQLQDFLVMAYVEKAAHFIYLQRSDGKYPPELEMEDLQQHLATEVVKAANRYDPATAVPFSAYVFSRVKYAGIDYRDCYLWGPSRRSKWYVKNPDQTPPRMRAASNLMGLREGKEESIDGFLSRSDTEWGMKGEPDPAWMAEYSDEYQVDLKAKKEELYA